MPKLNQVLAIEKQTKTNAHEQLTAAYQLLQKPPLMSGISKTYKPVEEEGERFPSESQEVQVKVADVLRTVSGIMAPLYNVTLARDLANCSAKADVVVDDVVILKDAPVTYLLWLEKQVTDLHTVVVKLPTLPQDESWRFNEAQAVFATNPTETVKTKKIAKPFVKYEATKEHPAQVEVVHEDVVQGYWTTTKFSGALQKGRVQELRDRSEKLLAAIKFAREQANLTEAPKVEAAAPIFQFLFA